MNQTDTLCHMAWDYLMFFPFDPAIGYCCRSPRVAITPKIRDEFKENLFSNYPRFVKRREDLLKGNKHADCSTCWALESKGYKSPRYDAHMFSYMEKNSGIVHKSIEELRTHPGQEVSKYADCIEIVLNNLCDAKCTYCSEMFSTAWYTEKKNFGDPTMRVPKDNRDPKLEQHFWDWYKNTGMRHMYRFGFIGGEPLIVDALYEYLDKLIEIHDQNPQPVLKEVCFTSNMNTPPHYFNKFLEYLPKLEKHFKIIIQASGENIGDELEYVRSGVIYSRWKENIEYFMKNTPVVIHFMPTLNLLSIPGLMRYLEYWEEVCNKYGPIHIHDNIVSSPRQQSPTIAPKEFALFLNEPIGLMERMLTWEGLSPSVRWSWDQFLTFLISTRESIAKNRPLVEMREEPLYFYRYFSRLDERRSTSVTQTFPDFSLMYRMGKKLDAISTR